MSQNFISIHALFAEGDGVWFCGFLFDFFISIHALFAEGDVQCQGIRLQPVRDFYPHPLRRGRQTTLLPRISGISNFYPRPLRRGRPMRRSRPTSLPSYFYPRPLRRGRRRHAHYGLPEHRFLSTPSSQRATRHPREGDRPCSHFYPRPLRRGRRGTPPAVTQRRAHFYPRPLRRGRPIAINTLSNVYNFYPRPLRRGRQV